MENDDKKVNESNSKFDIESNDVITNIDIAKNDIDKNSTNTIDAEEKDKSKKTKKEKKPKKPKTIKQIIISRIIFVIIFLAIVVGITYYFINLQSNNVNQENNIAEETTSIEQKSSYTTVDLNGSYYTNPIKISIKTESMDRVPDGFEYYEIDGLKNETIEKKINAYIKDNFKNYLKNLMDKTEENITYSVSLSVVGNFANIISLEMYISEDVNPDEYDFNYYCHFCNLNLICI
jgi:flagellar basal body-associated protein FliL